MFWRPLISLHPWPVRWTGTEAEQGLWRSQSSVTDKVIMLLLFAFKAVIKCDRDCPAVAPTGRQWGVQQQDFDKGGWRVGTPDELLDVFILVAKIRQPASALETTSCSCLRAKSVKICVSWLQADWWFQDTLTHVTTECLHIVPGVVRRNEQFRLSWDAKCRSNCNPYLWLCPTSCQNLSRQPQKSAFLQENQRLLKNAFILKRQLG